MTFELIDDFFYVEQKEWGTWNSYDRNGNPIVTSFTKEECISATHFYFKGRQESFAESRPYEGIVNGKL